MGNRIKLEMLSPRQTENFKCLGANCPDTCCAGWQVDVDQHSYEKYLKLKKAKGVEFPINFIHRNISESNKNKYAIIQLKENDKSCSYLENKLCSLQSKLGEDYLSDVCDGYPRTTIIHGDLIQQGLALSCPEVARLSVLGDKPIDFIKTTKGVRKSQIQYIKSSCDDDGLEISIRLLILQILRDENLSTKAALLTIGFLCEELDNQKIADKNKRYLNTIVAFKDLFHSNKINETLNNLKQSDDAFYKTFSGILISRVFKQGELQNNKILQQCFSYNIESTKQLIEAINETYHRGEVKFNNFIKTNSFFLKNILAIMVFNEAFPFNKNKKFDAFKILVSRYGVLKILMSIKFGQNNKEVTALDLLNIIQTYAKKFEHDNEFKQAITTALSDSGFNRMQYIAGLIK